MANTMLEKDAEIRKQVERLAKFLIWSDEITKNALSAQPYAALAWSGVSMLSPVSLMISWPLSGRLPGQLLTSGSKQNETMLKGFNSISDLQVYWRISETTHLQSLHGQNYRDLLKLLARLYSYIVEYQARVLCHLSSAQLSRAWQDVASGND